MQIKGLEIEVGFSLYQGIYNLSRSMECKLTFMMVEFLSAYQVGNFYSDNFNESGLL